MLNRLDNIHRGFATAVTVLLILMTLMISVDVISRRLFAYGLLFSVEYSEYMVVAITFFCLGWGLRSGALIRVEALYMRLSQKVRQIVDIIYDVVCLAFSVLLTYESVRLVVESYRFDTRAATIYQTSLFWPRLVVPIGLTMLCIALLTNLFIQIRIMQGQIPDSKQAKELSH